MNIAFVASIASFSWMVGTISASPASLEAHPGGTLLLTVLGERLLFRSDDEKRIIINGRNATTCLEGDGDLGFDPKPPQSLYNTLARWLVDPVKARCFEALAPTSATDPSARFIVGGDISRDGRLLYSGVFDPGESNHPAHLIEGYAVRIGAVDPYMPRPCEKITAERPADTNGYRERQDIQTSASFVRYDDKLGNRSTCVTCNHIAVWTCAMEIHSTDNHARVSLVWHQESLYTSPRWREFESALRNLTKAIFIDRAAEDFN